MSRPSLRDEDAEAFDRDWLADVDTATMGARYGMARGSVSGIAKRRGLPGRYRKGDRGVIATRGTTTDRAESSSVALTGGRWVPGRNGVQVWSRS